MRSRVKSLPHRRLHIDFIPPRIFGLPGRLGMTVAPGRKGPGLDGLFDRNLAADLKTLVDRYRTDVLVSLLEPHEYKRLGIRHLSERAAEAGIRVLRFPLPDGGVPAPQERGAFELLVHRILRELADGHTVVIHCRAGLGRTGLLAACVLVERGRSAEEAIDAVRTVRPGAVETWLQEMYIVDYAESRRKAGVVIQ